MEVGGIEPHTRVVAQGLTPHCDHFVTVFLLLIIDYYSPFAGHFSIVIQKDGVFSG